MRSQFSLLASAFILSGCLALTGCMSSGDPGGQNSDPATGAGTDPEGQQETKVNGGGTDTENVSTGTQESEDGIPLIEVMSEIDGIEIPRIDGGDQTLTIKGEVPLDLGNDHAEQNPSQPVTGGGLIIRLNSEPKTLNPIVETSAVQQYISEYTNLALARLDPETLEYTPDMCEKWVAEDSVKLSPSYAGHERSISSGGGQPTTEVEVTYAVGDGDEPASITLTSHDGEGNPVGNCWVGLYPTGEDMAGAPAKGYHYWTDADGMLTVSGIVDGTYRAVAADELFGKATEGADGSLSIAALTPGNPLSEMLNAAGESDVLELGKDDWIDVQKQTIYTYFLKPEVKWADGTPYTTRDLEFAYAVINNPFVDGESLRVYYQDLIQCQALDEQIIRMKYRQQYFKSFEFTAGLAAYGPPLHVFEGYFREDGKTLTLENLTPEEEEAQGKVSAYGQVFGKFFNTDDRYNLKPLGTGPYIVDEWVRADRVELRRNPNHWDTENGAYLDKLVFKFIPDNVTAMQALKAGEIDFFFAMNSEQFFEDLEPQPDWFQDRYVKAQWFSPGFSYVGWNLLNPLFQDRRVRVALRLLFNVEEFVDKKLRGAAVPISGSQYYFGPGYDHDVKPIGYDPEAARDLLADAGWIDTDNDGILDKNGEDFSFSFLMPPGNPVVEEQAALIQEAFKGAGIKMEVDKLEWASFLEKVKGKEYDVVRLGWSQPLESDPFQIWHGSQAGLGKRSSNHVSFSNPQADALIEMLRLTLDEEKRKRIHSAFHRILDREQPYMFLYTPKDFGAYHRRVRGVKWYNIRPGFDLTEWYVPTAEQTRN